MKFLDDLRRYLERPEPPLGFEPDVAAHRKHLLQSLDQVPKDRAQRIHRDLSPHLEQHVAALALLLKKNVGASSPEELERLIDVALGRHAGVVATSGSLALDLEIDLICTEALAPRVWKNLFFEEFVQDRHIHSYATNVGLVRKRGTSWGTTPAGKLVSELAARDAVRWLLALECVQSHSMNDDWRISRSSAAALIENPRWNHTLGEEDAPPPPASWITLDRMAKLGLILLFDTRRGVVQYALLDEGRPILEEIASGKDTPFMLLARALLQDETASVLSQYPAAAAMVRKESAASLVTRHARMVAHEMRNVVVPMQIRLGAFYEEVGNHGPAALTGPHRHALDAGVDRLLGFVQSISEIADLATTPAEMFTLAEVITDALQAVAAEVPSSIPFVAEAELPAVMGYRQRFIMALTNLLRNAAQSRQDRPVQIRVTAGLHNGAAVFVHVDDDGPGVATEDRTKVFTLGFSRRAGGSGQGLAYVREVVEDEMLGKVSCEESPLGGARFVIRLPAGTRRSV